MIYRFDDYAINDAAFDISRSGKRLQAEPQVLELLLVLIRNRDRVVTKEELLAEVWKGRFVSDSALSSRVKSARRLLGDSGSAQRYIRTVHGRGFRFVAEVENVEFTGKPDRPRPSLAVAAPLHQSPAPADSGPRSHPQTRYAKSGEIHIAYHLFGDGPVDLVLTPGFVSHIDNFWDDPNYARWLDRMGRFARVAMFDKRGTGLSDPVGRLPGMDERMDDVRAVMDAAGFEKAAIMGVSEGGSLASLFAASHPERSQALVLYGAFACFSSWFPTAESLQELFDYIESDWGTGKSVAKFAPSMAHDPAFMTWWGKFERLGATPGAAIALMRMNSQIDIADVLATIQVPTLVIHRADDVLIDVEGGRFLAKQIPGARYVELPGSDHLAWVGENALQIPDIIEEFVAGLDSGGLPDRALATVLVSELVASGGPAKDSAATNQPDLVEAHKRLVRKELARFHGVEAKTQLGNILATFDGPARAIRCALSIATKLGRSALEARIGLHTGEVDLLAGEPRGIAVELAAQIAAFAKPGDVVVSRTVKDLVAGSEIAFDDLGTHGMAGMPDGWQLYRATG